MASPLWALVVSERSAVRPDRDANRTPNATWSCDSVSRLRATIERVSGLVPASRTVTVTGPADRAGVSSVRGTIDLGHLLKEPADRGTAPAILLGLADILDARPDAHVLVTSSDYDLRDPYQFRFSIRATAGWIRAGHSDIVVFGVKPSGTAEAPSWVAPAPTIRRQGPRQLLPVAGFVDHATRGDAEELARSGAVWNTGVLVARAQALFELYQRSLPELVDAVMHARHAKASVRDVLLAEAYQTMRPTEFSRDALRRADGIVVYVWPSSVGWSRHDAPDRLRTWEHAGMRRRLAPVLDWAPTSVRRAFGS